MYKNGQNAQKVQLRKKQANNTAIVFMAGVKAGCHNYFTNFMTKVAFFISYLFAFLRMQIGIVHSL